ncbi:MAG: hypothetical protein KTR35_19805 [Gammaproteobacteria bacterium]|nr:hypothetical protein [Gammaproteobacteria bacterium]
MQDASEIVFRGIPAGNESVWFHCASGTLILTDLCQFWDGKLSVSARMYARLNGVDRQMAVPGIVRWLISNKHDAAASAQKILNWLIKRIVLGHNCIVENDAHERLNEAFSVFT